MEQTKYAILYKRTYSLLIFSVWENKQFGEIITMEQPNNNSIIIKQNVYAERRSSDSVYKHQLKINEYNVNIFPLTNMHNRILRNKFDVKQVKDSLPEVIYENQP